MKYILFGFIWVGLAVAITIALNKLKLTELDWVFALLGLALFIKITPENPVLWTGMKGVSAMGR